MVYQYIFKDDFPCLIVRLYIVQGAASTYQNWSICCQPSTFSEFKPQICIQSRNLYSVSRVNASINIYRVFQKDVTSLTRGNRPFKAFTSDSNACFCVPGTWKFCIDMLKLAIEQLILALREKGMTNVKS